MSNVTLICMQRFFNLEEATALLPTVKRIFAQHEKTIQRLLDDQRFFISTRAPDIRVKECDDKICEQMTKCGAKLHKLGVKVLGDSYIGFSTGSMYWSYRYPESNIEYYHGLFEKPQFVRHPINATSAVY